MTIRQSYKSDSDALIQLSALTPMKGLISLCIERKPDFFRLLEQRGEYFVLVAENEAKSIVGSFSATKQMFMINGTLKEVYYLGDLKVHPGCKISGVAHKLVKSMYNELLQRGADLLFCTIAAGNDAVMPFFEGRTAIPSFKQTCRFHVMQLMPKPNNRLGSPLAKNISSIKKLYDKYYSFYSFYPEIKLNETDIHLTEEENGKIKAAITLSDPYSFKQNVVIDYAYSMAIISAILKPFRLLFEFPYLPEKGKPLKILYVKYYGFEKYYETLFASLLRKARHYAYENGFHFVSIPVNDRNTTLLKLVNPLSLNTFLSAGYVTSLQKNDSMVEKICSGMNYEDYSLV